ncbi:RHS repeat domain-containing protein [Filimonas zeae]|uniref:RHS repeat domain-containing protein n=1 Tax=Filimonas zeae TaxID=1737353 RepID=UPI00286A9225|nr:RHS repeat domain-containing protein [Filimonas zeae]
MVYSAYPLPVHFDVNIDNPDDHAVRPLKPVGGVTVKSVADHDGAGNLVNRRNFIYEFGTNQPDLLMSYFPDNLSDEGLFYTTIRGTENDYFFYMYQIMSNTTYGMYVNDYSTITFPKVTEQWVDQNGIVTGGIEHEYMAGGKSRPVSFGNKVIPDYVHEYSSAIPGGAQSSNGDLHNGKELTTRTFKMVGQVKRYMSETVNHYSTEPSTAFTGTYYAVQQLISRPYYGYEAGVPYFADYNVSRYYVYSNWLKLDETITTTYTDAGEALQQTQQFQYANTTHMQPTLVKTFNSKEQIKTVINKYPHDFAATAPYGDMVSRHIITPVVEQTQRNESILLQELARTKTNYSYLGQNTLFRAASIASSIKGNDLETDVSFDQYDDKGNVLQYTGRDGVITCFVWGYNKQFPVAKIIGKAYVDVINQSGVNMSIVNSPATDNALRTELNKIRTLSSCQVTSFTYAPLVGMTSQTDPAGRITYYEYDAAGRLHLVRDQSNHIVKMICYNFYGQPVNCN